LQTISFKNGKRGQGTFKLIEKLNEEESTFDLIEKYHQGLLTEEERDLVEKRIQTDASFAEYLNINGLTNDVVHAAGLDILRERMTKDLALLEKKRIRRNWKIGAGIMAALLALLSIIYLIKYPSKKTSHPIPINPQEQISGDNMGNKRKIVSGTNDKNTNTGNSESKEPERTVKIDTMNIKNNSTSFTVLPGKRDSVYTAKESTVEIHNTEKNIKECSLSFEVIIQASCKGETSGAIAIDQQSLSGGTRPYHFQISDSRQESSSGIFPDLGKGQYKITMYDSKTCRYSKEIVVPDKNCTSKKSFSFNPDYGESWKVPSMEGESGSFTIYNRAGITIFKGNFTGHQSAEWFGTNTEGIIADVGLYVSIIEYSGGKTETIEISIVR
jgi:hypothetical protein